MITQHSDFLTHAPPPCAQWPRLGASAQAQASQRSASRARSRCLFDLIAILLDFITQILSSLCDICASSALLGNDSEEGVWRMPAYVHQEFAAVGRPGGTGEAVRERQACTFTPGVVVVASTGAPSSVGAGPTAVSGAVST